MLSEYLRREAGKSFCWGISDCATLAIGWADFVLGSDGLKRWAGWYSTAEQCADFITGNGGFEAIARGFVKSTYGFNEAEAAAGNVVLARMQDKMMMGIRMDERHAAFRFETVGLYFARRFEPIVEWRVPCLLS